MPKVKVTCDPYGVPCEVGNLVHMLTFTSDSAPLNVGEEDARGITLSTVMDDAYAENETNIVVGPITRAVVSENGIITNRPGKHTYRLLLVEA